MDNFITHQKSKVIRVSKVAISLDFLLRGQLKYLQEMPLKNFQVKRPCLLINNILK